MNLRLFWIRFKVLIAILIIIIGFYIYFHPREFGGSGGGWFFTPDLEIIDNRLSVNGINITSHPAEIKGGDVVNLEILIKNNFNESRTPAIWIYSDEIVDIEQYALWHQEKCSGIETKEEGWCGVEFKIDDLAPLGKTNIALIASVYEPKDTSPSVRIDEIEFNVEIINAV